MRSSNLIITPRDPLLFRDGRPFGPAGVAYSGGLKWPRYGTLAGMLRTYIGLATDSDYFGGDNKKNVEEVLKISIGLCLPGTSIEDDTIYLPAPADAVAYPSDDKENNKLLLIKRLEPRTIAKDEGTDIEWENFQYPWIEEQEKPKEMPEFWRWSAYLNWLIYGSVMESGRHIDIEEIIFKEPPVVEKRTHVCINKKTGSALDSSIYITENYDYSSDLRFFVQADIPKSFNIPQRDMAVLGGERRLVHIDCKEDFKWPTELPEEIGHNGQGLRLILVSPGLFKDGWLPSMLMESLKNGKWSKFFNTDILIRLRSACIPNFVPCHGWDMTKGKFGAPKPMRKMVPAGSVYFIEVEDESRMKEVAQKLWNTSLCEDEQDRRDGLGRVLVGNWL